MSFPVPTLSDLTRAASYIEAEFKSGADVDSNMIAEGVAFGYALSDIDHRYHLPIAKIWQSELEAAGTAIHILPIAERLKNDW